MFPLFPENQKPIPKIFSVKEKKKKKSNLPDFKFYPSNLTSKNFPDMCNVKFSLLFCIVYCSVNRLKINITPYGEINKRQLSVGDIIITFEPRHEKICLRESPTRQDTNWPGQLQRPARILKFRIYKLEVSFCLGSEQQRRWSDFADAQADLCYCCSHMAYDTFSHGLAHLDWTLDVMIWSTLDLY